ncbi:MAG TPA: hypothetical protein VGR93_08245, partial [Candidatus Acidoferrales bacterium]|nr:hypothetical protein [Candidatus Acidoferrales bacterium]
DGHIAPGASVAVCAAQGIIGYGNSPCSPLATIYTDATLATQAANPFVADSNGDYGFWAPPGTYQVEVYGPQIGAYIQTVTVPCVPNTTTTGCGSAATQGNNTWTGANTFNGDALFKSGDPWFDVKAFGAKCDDVTDDTAALQATLAAVPATGGLVEIPGVCKFTQTLVVNAPNVTIEGKGHFQFITQNAPVTYLDYQGANGNAIFVGAQGFKMRDVGIKYPTTIGGPLAPPAVPTLTQVAGSGCPAEPYYAQSTYVTAQGETSVSAEATFTTTAGNCLQVTSPPSVSGATGWNLYVSSNPNNETKQNATPLAIGGTWTFTGTLANLGYRPPFNTTAYSAIYDDNGAQLDGVKIFTDAASSAGTASMANGYTGFGCCGNLHNVYIAGFGVGVAGAGSNNDFSVTDSYIQSNYVGAFIVNGADINIVRDDFEGNVAGNVKMLYGSPYTITQNYFEQQGTNPPSYNVQVGDTAIPPQGFAPTPGAVVIAGNFMQCNLTAYPPSPIVIDTTASLRIERNSFSQCGHQNIIDNLAGAGASIKVLGNISDAAPLSWITSASGLAESDLSGTQLTPGTPFFYGLGVDSSAGNSSLLFRAAGSSAWNLNASTSALSFGFNAHNGENTLQLKPFGSQTFASVQSNYAMDAAEVIVTQSGASAAFDAGLGNTFEITLTGNVTSSTLTNVQPGQWLAFIICQGGSGGPWTFAWPSNVFGGGTIGSVGGNCSTQTFYASGSNAWAVAPMMMDLSTGVAGLSLPAAAGAVPYFTGGWTNGNCLQAGGSIGLITVTNAACGTGGAANIDINGSAVSSPNFNGTAPAPDSGYTLATWKVSGSNVSVEVPTGGGGGGSPGGSATQIQYRASPSTFGGIAGSTVTTHGGVAIAPTGDTPALQLAPNAGTISDPLQVFSTNAVAVPSAPSTGQTSGGLLSARTDYVKIVYVDFRGVATTPSSEVSQSISASNLLTVSSPSASNGAAGWLPAISSASGAETLIAVTSANCTPATGMPESANAICAIGANYTEPGAGFVSGSSLPGSNASEIKSFYVDAAGNVHCQSCSPYSGSVSATAPSTVGCSDATATLTGVTTAMAVAISPQTSPGANVSWSGFVSAANTVDVRLCTLAAFTPSAVTFNIRVLP